MSTTDSGRLVVVGASAGGIEALTRLFATVPKSFPAPIVVAQHLDPRVKSHLDAIIAKRTHLSVVAVNGREELKPGTIYVVPSDRHVEILDGHVSLRENSIHPKPSIDLLFASAAEAYRERLVAVVLTGMGSDGSAGAEAVKRKGGTVIIEDPTTASFPSMPAALSPAMVDIIAPIDRIAAELERVIVEETTVTIDAAALKELLHRIHQTSGVDFSYYKEPTIKRRVARQIARAGLSTLSDYLDYLDRTPGEYERLVENFFIKVTEFFRDPELFAALKATVIPELIREARSHANEIRVWSAGCATGEEPYSVGILLAEALGDELADFKVRIFSTDIDEGSVAYARRGVYPPTALANVPANLLARYFVPVGDMYEIGKDIRAMTVFGQHDLGQRAPFPRIDLVLCRNVLIYFNRALQERTLELFAFSMRRGGFLALGKAETSSPKPAYFEPVDQTLRIFRRHGDRMVVPPVHIPRNVPRPAPLPDAQGVASRAHDGRRTLHEYVGDFLMNSDIGFVAVDERYDISSINAAARNLLNIHGIAIGDDLIHLMPADCGASVRAILDAALRSERPQAIADEIMVPGGIDHQERFLMLSAYPSTVVEGRTQVGLLIVDVTTLVERRRASERQNDEHTEQLARLHKEQGEREQHEHALLEANRQLTTANADLRASNDALLIHAEEAAASAEEIETLNEEMQATNEELETLNEEFQATIEELNTTNDELEARSLELQEMVITSEAQRQDALAGASGLQALADAMPAALATISAHATVIAKNQPFARLERLGEENVVHIIDGSGATLSFGALVRRGAARERFSFTYELILNDQSRETYAGEVFPTDGGGSTASAIVRMVPKT